MMSSTWQLQEANNKLSEVVEAALTQGPQGITRLGIETAAAISYAEYRRLALRQTKLSAFFQNSPLAGEPLDFVRDQSELREDIPL